MFFWDIGYFYNCSTGRLSKNKSKIFIE
uniref:Uncharacterized protein n=1 Tax=Anguilla anguilla TaxID=7936 RepID=A0A0E9Q664_ANGAN